MLYCAELHTVSRFVIVFNALTSLLRMTNAGFSILANDTSEVSERFIFIAADMFMFSL